MDRDTMARKGASRRLLDSWQRGDLDVVVGTQMVTKGHDIPGLTLVGVIAADQSLHLPDFRASERTFQLLTQVAGRAGRATRPGRVLIQTYTPDHDALRFAATHDFLSFAEHEIATRRAVGYPPFTRLVNLRFEGTDASAVENTATALATAMRESLSEADEVTVLGPAPAPIERRRGRYRWQILLKGRDSKRLRQFVQAQINPRTQRTRDGVRIITDVDPYGML
jgi:primosomal protein N' (replication factor Y)